MLSLADWTAEDVHRFLNEMERKTEENLWKPKQPVTVGNLFFEPSTRTKCSFEMAEKQLGLEFISFDAETSSVQKGESLYDTAKTMEAIGCDALVIRHPEYQYYQQLTNLQIPIINAGDGGGDHPTQSLLDLLTIKQEFEEFNNLHIVIAGDIRHSRVARTNADILERLGATVSFSGPREWQRNTEEAPRFLTIEEAVRKADVMMMLRIQTERHEEGSSYSPAEYHQRFGLTEEREKKMKPGAIIMHPAPINRDVEIASEIVECRRSRIFTQMKNGVTIRKAVLEHVLNLKGESIYDLMV